MFQLLDTFFSFLARKTDFYTGGEEGAAEKLVNSSFQKHASSANAERARKAQEKIEREKKMREKAAAQTVKQDPGSIREVTDEEAAQIQMEIDKEKKEKDKKVPESKAKPEIVEDEDEVSLILSYNVLRKTPVMRSSDFFFIESWYLEVLEDLRDY